MNIRGLALVEMVAMMATARMEVKPTVLKKSKRYYATLLHSLTYDRLLKGWQKTYINNRLLKGLPYEVVLLDSQTL